MPPTNKSSQFYPAPIKGIARNKPPYALTPDELFDARNVIVREGVLQPRVGFLAINSTSPLNGTPNGSGLYVKTDSSSRLIVITTTKVYAVSSGPTITDLGGGLTASATQLGRMTTLALGSGSSISNYLITTNGKDAPKKWDGAAASMSSVAGSPPLWTDITTIDDKVIGLLPPYQVSWGATRAIDVWPALHFKLLAETPDPGIAVCSGPIPGGGTVYKRDTIWSIIATGNTSDASAFRFPFATESAGPANPASVVATPYGHLRMTKRGRIGLWDGTKNTWVADQLWPLVRFANIRESFGWYDPDYDEVHFSFAGTATFPLQYVVTLTHLADGTWAGWVQTLNGRLVNNIEFGESDNASYRTGLSYLEGTTRSNYILSSDDNVANTGYINVDSPAQPRNIDTRVVSGVSTNFPIYGWWHTGLTPMPNLDVYRIEAVETFASRGQNYGNLVLQPHFAYTLGRDVVATDSNPLPGVAPGQVGQSVNVSLQGNAASSPTGPDEPVRADDGLDITGRFIGLKYSFPTADPTAAADHLTQVPKFRGALLKIQKVTV